MLIYPHIYLFWYSFFFTLAFWVILLGSFSFAWRSPLNISYSKHLLAIHILSCCFSGNIFILPSSLKNIFTFPSLSTIWAFRDITPFYSGFYNFLWQIRCKSCKLFLFLWIYFSFHFPNASKILIIHLI